MEYECDSSMAFNRSPLELSQSFFTLRIMESLKND